MKSSLFNDDLRSSSPMKYSPSTLCKTDYILTYGLDYLLRPFALLTKAAGDSSTLQVDRTLYLSNTKSAFGSGHPLSFKAPSRQKPWSYYKVSIPLGSIATIKPIVLRDNPPERYIQIVTIDGHDGFIGFAYFEKAALHRLQTLSTFRAQHPAVGPVNVTQTATQYE